MTFDRRSFLRTLAGAGAIFAAGCKAKGRQPEGSAQRAARPAPWEPVDPAFTGCEGG